MRVVNYKSLQIIARKRKQEFGAAEPYAHIVIDDFLTNEAAEALLAEFSLSNKWSHYNHYNERKMGLTNIAEFGAGTRKIVSELSSQPFLEFLESLTGFDRLLGDPDLDGGGLHQIMPQGYLNVHADFQSHTTRPKWRRMLNLLIYLNKGWQDEWGGHLELWDADMTRPVRKIRPEFNRCVIFPTTTESMHGHPMPLACPINVSRKSLALYYFRDEGIVQKLRPTYYRARPDETALKHVLVTFDRWLVKGYSILKRYTPIGDQTVSRILRLFSR